MITVYHVASMGDPWYWRHVVNDQFRMLSHVGINAVRLTHVGPDLDDVLLMAEENGIAVALVKSDPNIHHYETFAMLEIERLAKVEMVTEPILYLHTKGVSCPGQLAKYQWRKAMEKYVVEAWRENVGLLDNHDAVGYNWMPCGWMGGVGHFVGTFWIATAEWIRGLPDFVAYHHANKLVRFTCETWIGANHAIRPKSVGCHNVAWWQMDYRQMGINVELPRGPA